MPSNNPILCHPLLFLPSIFPQHQDLFQWVSFSDMLAKVLKLQYLSFQWMLLLLLSCFSCVRLCETPETAAHQASPSLGFSRQEHWSGLPFPSPMHESEKWKWSRSVVSDSSDPMDCSPPGSSIHWDFPGKSTGVECHCLLPFQWIVRINFL